MTETEVIRIMREHLEGQFPKTCASCGRRFATLREYLLVTEHRGSAMPYDADEGDWQPLEPLGTATYANCPCGNTLVLSSDGMPLFKLWLLLHWAMVETRRRRLSPQELLNYLREKICAQVFSEPDQGDEGTT
jgi:hypothetical protein